MKKTLLTTFLLVSLFSFASAQSSLGDLEPGAEGSISFSEKVCYDLRKNLGQKNLGTYRNSDRYTNNEVTKLQNFLQDYNFLNVEATGYFGIKTIAAVKSFQTSIGILSSGYVGPITRAKIKMMSCDGGASPVCNSEQHLENGVCKNNTTAYTCLNGSTIQVPINISQTAKEAQCGGSQTEQTPTFSYTKNPSGTSPLSVDFYVAKNISNCSYASGYSVDFGDGQSVAVSVNALNSPNSNTSVQCGGYFASHKYTSTGTYTAKLMKNTCPAGAQCFVGPTVVTTLTIILIGNDTTEINPNNTYNPKCPDGTQRQTTIGGSKTGCEGHGEGNAVVSIVTPKTTTSGSLALGSRTSPYLSTLIAVLSGAESASAESCANLATNLHRGNETESVSKLQNFLIAKGFLSEKASGFFGDLTIEAVKAYQRSLGLKETGMVYDITRQAIREETCQ